jgi:nicotinate-nucleotide adenylyltransferase
MTRLVGLLGGTFDPVHNGHLDLAQAARHALDLSPVMLLPSNIPTYRTKPVASATHRFAMAALASLEQEGLTLSDAEVESGGPSFTADTLDRLAARRVDLGRLVFIAGADAFAEIATWKDYPAVLDRCHFAVVSRPEHPALGLPALLPALAARMIALPSEIPSRPAIFLVNAPTAAVSSSDVRHRLERGERVDDLVPASVARYIARQGLYGPTGVA